MRLFYYEDVTPADYEPPCFKATVDEKMRFDDQAVRINIGHVESAHHAYAMPFELAIAHLVVSGQA